MKTVSLIIGASVRDLNRIAVCACTMMRDRIRPIFRILGMRKIFWIVFSCLFLTGNHAFALDEVNECYKNMTKKEQKRDCLTLEAKQVQSQYNSVLELVLAKARMFDRANKKRQAAKSVQEANRLFNLYMKEECAFRSQIKGAEDGETEVLLACRINLMRLRKNVLETDYLNPD